MLHDPAHTMVLGHDLHGRGPRGCLDLTQVRTHPPDPTAALVPRNDHPTPRIPTKNPTLKHKPPQPVQLRWLGGDAGESRCDVVEQGAGLVQQILQVPGCQDGAGDVLGQVVTQEETSLIASRTRSCTIRTITEATVNPPEIAPATPPVIRRCWVCPSCRGGFLADDVVATSPGLAVGRLLWRVVGTPQFLLRLTRGRNDRL